MMKRLEHLPSTLTGTIILFIGFVVGIIFDQWEITTMMITAALYLLAYKPKENKNAND